MHPNLQAADIAIVNIMQFLIDTMVKHIDWSSRINTLIRESAHVLYN